MGNFACIVHHSVFLPPSPQLCGPLSVALPTLPSIFQSLCPFPACLAMPLVTLLAPAHYSLGSEGWSGSSSDGSYSLPYLPAALLLPPHIWFILWWRILLLHLWWWALVQTTLFCFLPPFFSLKKASLKMSLFYSLKYLMICITKLDALFSNLLWCFAVLNHCLLFG